MCAYGVQLNLGKLPGVERCEVSYRKGVATLVYTPGVEPDFERIRAVVAALGYTPGRPTVTAGAD